MKTESECQKAACVRPAALHVTWPGREEQCLCMLHFFELRSEAAIQGVELNWRAVAGLPGPPWTPKR